MGRSNGHSLLSTSENGGDIEMGDTAIPMDPTDAEYCDADDDDDDFEDEFSGNIGAMPSSFRPLHADSSGGSCRRRGCITMAVVLVVSVGAVFYGMNEYGNSDLVGIQSDNEGGGILDEDKKDEKVGKPKHDFNGMSHNPPNSRNHDGHWDFGQHAPSFNGSDYHMNEEYYMFGKKRNRTEDAMDAFKDRWDRTHPEKPFPGFNQHIGDAVSGFGGNIDACRLNMKNYHDWIHARVSLSDGQKFEVVETLDHDGEAFTQGLTFANGVLYESTGLYKESTVRILDPKTASVIKKVSIPDVKFGEGMTIFNDDQLIQLTWKSKPLTGYIYNATTLEQIKEFQFSTTRNQGWGITFDECHHRFIVTDGSEYLHFWNVNTLEEIRKVRVQRQNGKPATQLNEIEFYRNRVIANVWFEDVLLVINPLTGEVEKEYDFSSLWPRSERNRHADVLNGISVSDDPDILYVTGKLWAKMFKVKLGI